MTDEIDHKRDALHTMAKLAMAANHYRHSSPQAACFYMIEMNRSATKVGSMGLGKDQSTCLYCGTVFIPGNYSVTFKPKMKINKNIKQLQRKQKDGANLRHIQHKILERYDQSRNRIIRHCSTCGKRDTLRGGTRNESLRVAVRKERLHRKQQEQNKKKSQKKVKTPKLTPAVKKRLKQREKRRERAQHENESFSGPTLKDRVTPGRSIESPNTNAKTLCKSIGKGKQQDNIGDFVNLIKSEKQKMAHNKNNTAKNSKKFSGQGRLAALLAKEKGSKKGGSSLLSFLSSI